MKATARFSKQFYDRLGEDIVNEMASWWEQERSELRELNERNTQRLDAKLEVLRLEVRADLAALRADLLKWQFIFFVTTILAIIGLR